MSVGRSLTNLELFGGGLASSPTRRRLIGLLAVTFSPVNNQSFSSEARQRNSCVYEQKMSNAKGHPLLATFSCSEFLKQSSWGS